MARAGQHRRLTRATAFLCHALEPRVLLSLAPEGPEFRVSTYTSSQQYPGNVAIDADGDFVVTWMSLSQDGSGYGIYAQRFNAAGVAQGSEFRVNTHTPNHQRVGGVAMDAAGDFVVTWESYLQDGSNIGIYAQRYNAAGAPQGAEFRVNALTAIRQRNPDAAMDADGDFVLTWDSFDGQDGSGNGVYAKRYDAAGVPQGATEFRVNSHTTNDQAGGHAAMDAGGDFVITWTSTDQDGSEHGIYAQRYNSAGVPLGAEFRVNSYTTSGQSISRLAMDADGDLVIAWRSYDQDGSSDGVYAQRYTVVPTVGTSSFRFATAPHRLQFAFDENVSTSLGTEDLIVQNLTTMQTIPASDFSIAYDPLTNTGTFSYTGSAGGIAGVLQDGNYRATLLAAGVTTPNGNALPADHVLNFHFLQGDANHDARVNLDDFNVLAANFGQSPRDFTQGDFDYTGNVNLNDFNLLASRFGATLGPDGAVTGAGSERLLAFPPPRAGLDTRAGGSASGDEDEGLTELS